MEKKDTAREWFGAVRKEAEDGVRAVNEAFSLNPLQQKELQILFRQFLYDGMDKQIAETDRMPIAKAQSICEEIYAWLMEDALAGTGADETAAQLSSFLGKCVDGVAWKDIFWDLFYRVLSPAVLTEEITDTCEKIVLDMELGMRVWLRERRSGMERKRNPDEPPPDLDEFEYIDWLISHRS